MPPKKIFLNGAIWCVLGNILLKFCKKKRSKNNLFFYIKIIDNILLRTLYLGYWSIFPRFLINCAIWCVLEHISREISLRIYI